jgi:SMI1/KNR4 family protein SUKH-1
MIFDLSFSKDSKNINPQTSKTKIDKIQSQLNINFPLAYINFLLKNNGGLPEKRYFEFDQKGGREKGCINQFYGLDLVKCGKDYYDLLTIYNIYVPTRRIPNNFIPIAGDPGGNQICIATKGEVYFWEHEYEVDEDKEPNMENMSLIANSFDQFINSLTAKL